jgi:type I restriction enzyme S subunit
LADPSAIELGTVADVVCGGTPSTSNAAYWGGDIVWVTPSDLTALEDRQVISSARRITELGLTKSSARLVPAGSVLVTSRATIGVAAIARCELALNQGVTALVPQDGISTEWLYYWVKANRDEFESRGSGTTFPEISRTKTRSIPIRVPAPDEQRRVADLLSAVDETISMARRYEHALRRAAIALRATAFAEVGAETVRLDEAVQVTMGRQRSPKHQTGDHIVPYLRAANVKDGYLELGDVLAMNFTPAEQAKFALQPGDVLVTEGCGSRAQIGASAQWHGELGEQVVCFQNTVLRLRAVPGTTIADFVYQWARWAFEQDVFADVSSGTSIFHIGAERAAAMGFPAAASGVQATVVETLTTADKAVELAAAQRQSYEQLLASTLRSLFMDGYEIPPTYDRLLSGEQKPAEEALV